MTQVSCVVHCWSAAVPRHAAAVAHSERNETTISITLNQRVAHSKLCNSKKENVKESDSDKEKEKRKRRERERGSNSNKWAWRDGDEIVKQRSLPIPIQKGWYRKNPKHKTQETIVFKQNNSWITRTCFSLWLEPLGLCLFRLHCWLHRKRKKKREK